MPGQSAFTRILDRSQDALGRPTGYSLGSAGVPSASGGILPPPEAQATYGYSATTGRLETVSNGTAAFRYDYLANSSLLEHVVATAGAVHDVHLAYEPTRNVLASRQNKVGTTVVSGYDYSVVNEGVNSLGQRTGVKTTFNLGAGQSSNAGDTSWGYDALGQVVSAATPNSTADRAYQYDTIGNRKKTSNTLTLPGTDNWDVNPLNQYSAIPQAPTAPVFDFDGNMTSGPLPAAPTANSTLVWDAENRLIETTVGPNGPLVQNYYDTQSRRIARTAGGETTVYVYDSWNCIAEYSILNSTFSIQHSNLWGLDLSGTMQGAGGVGGLLSVSLITNNSITDNYFPTFDGNGNVSEYLTSTGAVAAHFEYDPFGNTVVNTDTTNQFAYRFSTKPQDLTTGLLYYGYRWMDPLTGRWPSRDPIEEMDGRNLYGFVRNDGVGRCDLVGLAESGQLTNPVDYSRMISISLNLTNHPGYRCSGNYLWAAFSVSFKGLTVGKKYFATYTYNVDSSQTICGGHDWEYVDHGERTLKRQFASNGNDVDQRVTPLNQGLSGDRGWASPSIFIDGMKTRIRIDFTASVYESGNVLEGLSFQSVNFPDGFNGVDPNDSLGYFDDAFQYGAAHTGGFLLGGVPFGISPLATVSTRLTLDVSCCCGSEEYGLYSPRFGVDSDNGQSNEVDAVKRMKPR